MDPMAEPTDKLSRLKNRVYPPESPGLTSLLGLAVGVVIVAALSVAREVLIPIVLAVLLSFVLGPIVAALRKLQLPRGLAVALAAACALGVVLVLGFVIGGQVALLTRDLPRYAFTIERKVELVRGFATRQTERLSNSLGPMTDKAPAAKPSESDAPAPAGPIPVEVHNPAPGPLQVVQNLLLPAVSPLGTALIVFVVAIFILLQQEDLRDRLIRVFGSNDLHRTTAALDDAGKRLGTYYLALLAVNTAFGCVIGAGLYFIGVPSPILWGIMAGLLRFVPYIGAFGGAVFPLLLAAAVDPGWTMVAETAALFLLVEPLLGQVIEPLIYGRSTGLSPVSVVVSAIFWGWIWGGVGLLLSMPLTLCLVVLGKHIERLEFLYVLLGDKPALTPAESLYQRMLVGDADESLEQAEALLKERSIEQYYDDVAIPGLQLAANDSLRGVLTEEQLQGIMESICGVIVELPQPENEAAEPAREGTILCVSGRGSLDEAVCAMLAQVLGRHGQRAVVLPRTAVGRGQVETLDMTDVRMIVVSSLEGDNALAPLRYLIRRLRRQAAGVEIVVGMWASEGVRFDEDRVQSAVNADRYVSTLAAAIDVCLGRDEIDPGAQAEAA